jgi:hypothetical protein
MRSFYYRFGRNAFYALLLGACALLSGMLWLDKGGSLELAIAVLTAAGAGKLAFNAASQTPALQYDRQSLRIAKAWGGVEEVPWKDVHHIAGKVWTTRYMGIIPVSRSAYITITCEGGLLGTRRFRVSTTALGMSLAQSAALEADLKQAHVDAVGTAGVAMAGAGARGWGAHSTSSEPGEEQGGGFDPDAALARYLASKEAEQVAAPGAARPAMPQRPVFGRRVS